MHEGGWGATPYGGTYAHGDMSHAA